MNILAVVAHPDDVEMWCGGTLRKYAEKGHKISIIIATNGRTGTHRETDDRELIERREREELAASKFYEADVQFLRQDDGELFNDRQTRRQVINAIRRAKPDVIFTHPPYDENVDHFTTGELVRNSIAYLPLSNVRVEEPPLKRQPMVFFVDNYAGIGPMPEAFVDITKQFETKNRALLCHQSQLTADTHWLEMLEVQARFRGMQYNVKYAEAFTGFKLFESMPDYSVLP